MVFGYLLCCQSYIGCRIFTFVHPSNLRDHSRSMSTILYHLHIYSIMRTVDQLNHIFLPKIE